MPVPSPYRPRLAGFLSFLLPGWGQIYNGDWSRGLFILLLTQLGFRGLGVLEVYLNGGIWGLFVVGVVVLGVWVYVILDAVRGARGQDPSSSRAGSVLLFLVLGIATQIVLSSVVRSTLVGAYRFPTSSMERTLLAGDYVFASRVPYGAAWPGTGSPVFPDRAPSRGDVIVFDYPPSPDRQFIKRVIGLPGEQVEIIDKIVHIDGRPLDEAYVTLGSERIKPRDYEMPHITPRGAGNLDNYGPITVPAGQVFVLGDNRDNSDDSRFFGGVDLGLIRGRIRSVYFSWDTRGSSVRWSRIGKAIE